MARFVPGKVVRQFSLQGKKVVFRYPKRSDLGNFLRHINSLVEERACIPIQKRQTRAQKKKWLADFFQSARKGNQALVCVYMDGKYAGNSGLTRNKGDARRHVATLGIVIEKKFRNMGIGTELMKTMEQLARKEMGARVLELSYFEENLKSRHVYEKLGYREVGRIPMGINHYGKYMDEVIMVKVLE